MKNLCRKRQRQGQNATESFITKLPNHRIKSLFANIDGNQLIKGRRVTEPTHLPCIVFKEKFPVYPIPWLRINSIIDFNWVLFTQNATHLSGFRQPLLKHSRRR